MVEYRLEMGDSIQFSYNYEQLRFRSEIRGQFLMRVRYLLYNYITNYKYLKI